MIIQKAGVIKFLRYLGIFCALTMGFFSIVGSDESDVEDAAAQDVDLTLDPITVTKPAALDVIECETGLTINDGIIDAGVDTGDIKSVELNKLEARYRNSSWIPDTEAFKCSVSMTEDGGDGTNDITVGPIAIEKRGVVWSPWI